MTISTALVSENSPAETRSAELSKLTAAMTFSFIVGPALGSFLYKRNKMLPPLVRALEGTAVEFNGSTHVSNHQPWFGTFVSLPFRHLCID